MAESKMTGPGPCPSNLPTDSVLGVLVAKEVVAGSGVCLGRHWEAMTPRSASCLYIR